METVLAGDPIPELSEAKIRVQNKTQSLNYDLPSKSFSAARSGTVEVSKETKRK